MKKKKLLGKLLSGSKSVRFSELVAVAESVGFQRKRVSGSHKIYAHPDIPELINLQDVNGQAKPYQVRQLVKLIEKHNLTIDETE